VDRTPRNRRVPHHFQQTEHTCGPAAMRMVLHALLGRDEPEAELAATLGTEPARGTWHHELATFAEREGLRWKVRRGRSTVQDLQDLLDTGHVVVVCYWIPEDRTDHYALVKAVSDTEIRLLDPWYGPDHRMPLAAFVRNWRSDRAFPLRQDRWIMAIRPPDSQPPRGTSGPRPAGSA